MKTGIVLEGGAMRGLFSAGVLDVLMKNKIKFDAGIGVSAGICFGVNYKSNQIGRTIRYNTKYAGDKRIASWSSWMKTGDLYGVDFCYRVIPEKLDVFDTDTFINNPMDFWCVATDIETGQPVYHKLSKGGKADLDWIRASSSIPVFAHPVKIDNRKYWDGGVSDSIPVRFFEKLGFDRIVVLLTQPYTYRKEESSIQPIVDVLLHKYPKVLKDLKTRHEDYNKTLEHIYKLQKEDKLFVIQPPAPLNIGTMEKDPKQMKKVYEVGVREAEHQLDALRTYLNN